MPNEDKIDAFIKQKWDFVIYLNLTVTIVESQFISGNYNVSFYMFEEEKNRNSYYSKLKSDIKIN